MVGAEEGELAAQQVDRQEGRRDGVVPDLGIGKFFGDLRPAGDMAVLGMGEEERGDGFLCRVQAVDVRAMRAASRPGASGCS